MLFFDSIDKSFIIFKAHGNTATEKLHNKNQKIKLFNSKILMRYRFKIVLSGAIRKS